MGVDPIHRIIQRMPPAPWDRIPECAVAAHIPHPTEEVWVKARRLSGTACFHRIKSCLRLAPTKGEMRPCDRIHAELRGLRPCSRCYRNG